MISFIFIFLDYIIEKAVEVIIYFANKNVKIKTECYINK